MSSRQINLARYSVAASLVLMVFPAVQVQAQLFDNLKALSNEMRVGQPRWERIDGVDVWQQENPKGLAAGDVDGDGIGDWVVSRLDGKLVVGWGLGELEFSEPFQIIETNADSFRQIIIADLNGDGRPDVAAAAPQQGKIYIVLNNGSRTWAAPSVLEAWPGARNLTALDWDGDGVTDLMVGGPDKDVTRDFDRPWERPEIPPDTVQPAHGVVFYKGLGAGGFEERSRHQQLGTVGRPPQDADDSFPRPVYVMEKWRPGAETKDWLIATHALSADIHILRPGPDSTFELRDTIPAGAAGIRAMAIGALTQSADSTQRDLVVASRDLGTVAIYSLSWSESGHLFKFQQQFDVQGGPRSLRISDVDGDGWNDLVVISRNRDKVVVFRNDAGKLVPSTESSTGSSPRELADADFDSDGKKDFVVLNRDSASLTILNASAGVPGLERIGFAALDQSYPTDGDVAQLGVTDLNADGRDDVIQLHRSSAEVSVRLSGPEGRLLDPSVYAMGDRPSAMSLADINRDGKSDLVTANLGDSLGGLMMVRMGDGLGGFGPLEEPFRPPLEPNGPPPVGGGGPNDPQLPAGVREPLSYGALYAVLPVDLDGDGILDLAAGYYDCRIIFFKGDGAGNFVPTPGFSDHELYFLTGYEARFIVAADFDQDGDQDLGLAAWPGDVVVLENTGNFFRQRLATDPPYTRHFFPRFDASMAGARDIQIVDVNDDADPDLLIGTGSGTQVMIGKPGIDFARKLYEVDGEGGTVLPVAPTMNFPVEAMVTGDFDGDGARDDVAAVCTDDGCLHILTASSDGSGRFFPALQVVAPRTTFLATGDVDGDGKTDLVGSGSTLWVALSGKKTQATSPASVPAALRRADHMVINEILPGNSKVRVTDPLGSAQADNGDPDCIELYNAGEAAVSVEGWKLTVTTPEETLVFSLPSTSIPTSGRAVVMCTRNRVGPWVSFFKIPESGAIVQLSDKNGDTVDMVEYPNMKEDESFARFSDGHPVFRVNELPDPGRANLDNGAIEPSAELYGIDMQSFGAGQPLRFYAVATDDVGIVGMTIHWREHKSSDPAFRRVLLFDDGMNGDGGRLDGVFAGALEEALPAGMELEFYLEAEDLSGETKFVPGRPAITSEEDVADELYTLRVPAASGPTRIVEISEIVASNQRTVTDDAGQWEDYVELRNAGTEALRLDNFEVAENLFGGSGRLKFSEALRAAYPADDLELPPGRHRLIFCDSDTGSSPTLFHTSFKLSAEEGGRLFLFARTPSGTQEIVDYASFPPLGPDEACARIGVRGRFVCVPPTPGAANVAPGTLIPVLERDPTGSTLLLAVPTRSGQPVDLFSNDRLDPGEWWPVLPGVMGDGFERLVIEPVTQTDRFFRLRQ